MANEKISPVKQAMLDQIKSDAAVPKKLTERERRKLDEDRVYEKVVALVKAIHTDGKAVCMFNMARFISQCKLSAMTRARAVTEFEEALTGMSFIDNFGEWILTCYECRNNYALIRVSQVGQPILMYRTNEIFYTDDQTRLSALAELKEHNEMENNKDNPDWVDPNESTFDANGNVVHNGDDGIKVAGIRAQTRQMHDAKRAAKKSTNI